MGFAGAVVMFNGQEADDSDTPEDLWIEDEFQLEILYMLGTVCIFDNFHILFSPFLFTLSPNIIICIVILFNVENNLF